MILVSLHDIKADTWTQPHATHNRASALRELEGLVNDPNSTLVSSHPEDFALYIIGDWDPQTSELKPCNFILVANGHEVKHANAPSA